MSKDVYKSFGLWAVVAAIAITLLAFIYLLILGPVQLVASNGTLPWQVAVGPALELAELSGNRPEVAWRFYNEYLLWWDRFAGPLEGIELDVPATSP